jgi:hypothetical protein
MFQNNSNALNEFVSELIEKQNLTGLDQEVVAQIKADLLDRVEDRINAAVLANVPTSKLEYFEKLLDQSSPEEIQDFCRRNIYDLDQIIAQELINFRETYLSA